MADRVFRSGRRRCSIDHSLAGKSCGGGRDWRQIYAVYGTGEGQTLAFLLVHAALFAALSLSLLLYFSAVLEGLEGARARLVPALLVPFPVVRFLVGFVGSVAAFFSVCLLFAAGNVLYSSVALHWEMAQRMLQAVPDWSTVRSVLDVGCGRGILLNAVAARLKKEGSCGRVVGLALRREAAVAALRRAWAEGVGEYVTCRDGDARSLPFADGYFDVVVSAVHLSAVGRERRGSSSASAAAAERGRGLGEVVRVLKPGGVGVVWDLVCVPEYAQRLREMRMEDVRVSERVTAYMVSSHIVSFRKPAAATDGATTAPPDWRANIG
ncbi:unnamed protein product [Spirodela intermedia]|uniref:Methyltransferase type 11 domain-containing protein n=1 Tax=Spirodela intermedia TaxID=51605 RepID=A0A7I8JF52_SPIIN|nr:unnamed protein product [Spirodela intermedia]CAA6668808.1 unnamed protein product [Spirodela intermedia]